MSKRLLAPLDLLLAGAIALAVATSATAQFRGWEGSSIVDDPEWRKSFLGSYGFLSGAEPEIKATELELLREVIDVMKVNPQAAATMLEQQTGPQSSAALDFILANLSFQNGALTAAVQHYDSALAKFPDFRRAHKNLGLLMVQQARFEKAILHLGRAIELGDRDGRSYGLLGYAHLNTGNDLAAEQAYRNAILAQPDTRDWKIGLARALLAMEKHKEASALFAALIEENPRDATAWLLQANAFLGLDQPMAAAVNLEAVRMMGEPQASSLVLLGDIYMNASMPELAKSAYLEVIQSDAGGAQFETAYRAADLLLRTRAHEEAQEVLASIDAQYGRQLGMDDELRVLTLKARLARARGDEKEAAELLESVVQRDGTRGDALLELASYHRSRGQTEKALLLVERAQRLAAYEYPALLERAQLMVSEKEYEKAAELLREAQTIKSEPRVARFLAHVEQAIVPR